MAKRGRAGTETTISTTTKHRKPKQKTERELNAEAFENFYKTLYKRTRSTGRAGGNRPWARPQVCEALAVHPKQIKEAVNDAVKKGVQTDFDRQGRPLFRDRDHRKRYCQAYGIFDKDGGYGDAQKGQTRLSGYPEPTPDYSHLESAEAPRGVERASSVRYFTTR
jgi:hypothetical protein